MNSLEFINKLIKDYEKSKERFLHNLKKYPNDEVFTKCVKTREQELQTLQQIKNKLEAFEVVKNKLEYFKEDASVGIEEAICQTSKFTPTEIKTYLKALEIKNGNI